jgi:hypothetical protein
MALVVRANVVDIKADKPRGDDVFLVDTNVWYFLAYSRASHDPRPPKNYQMRDYPAYVELVLNLDQGKTKLLRSPLSYSELAHSIERCECQIHSAANVTRPFRERALASAHDNVARSRRADR